MSAVVLSTGAAATAARMRPRSALNASGPPSSPCATRATGFSDQFTAPSGPAAISCMESAVNEIVAKRMTKRQQMRWDRTTVQPFLDVRTAVLNGTLEDAFRRRYPGFRPANDGAALPAAA